MRYVITVSQITPGGGLTKYVCSLCEILTSESQNEVWIVATHASKSNPTLEYLDRQGMVKLVNLGDYGKFRKYIQLARLLRKISPDVLIVNYNAPTQYVLPFLPKRIKTVHILHSNTPDFYRVASINGKRTDVWIAPTPALTHYFDEYTSGAYTERIFTIPHGVEPPKNAPLKNKDIPQLTYVGVLYEHKGVKILPEIIKRLAAEGRKFHFTFIGEGILRGELENELQTEINNGLVEFTGRVSGDEVYRRLSETDIFVYPTHIDAFGLVIAEAMINEAVPVVTLLDGITDSIIDDGKNGYLTSQDNVTGFVEQILDLIDNQELLSKMSRNAAVKAREKFSIEKMKENYLAFFMKLTNVSKI